MGLLKIENTKDQILPESKIEGNHLMEMNTALNSSPQNKGEANEKNNERLIKSENNLLQNKEILIGNSGNKMNNENVRIKKNEGKCTQVPVPKFKLEIIKSRSCYKDNSNLNDKDQIILPIQEKIEGDFCKLDQNNSPENKIGENFKPSRRSLGENPKNMNQNFETDKKPKEKNALFDKLKADFDQKK